MISMTEKSKSFWAGTQFKILILVLLAILLVPAAFLGYLHASSPNIIRNPELEHYHFRMQILVNGKAENFADPKYQTGYSKDQCTADLPTEPIHFHDGKDQFVHIHWEGITGGMVMKYYGWNKIGGVPSALGYRFDDLKHIKKVPIHGNLLPSVPEDANYYVYVGDEKGYKEKSFQDWTNQDLEKFFGKTSNFPAHQTNSHKFSLIDKLFPRAYAHGTLDDGHSDPANNETDQERLTRINNLLGNVVIFAQKDKPSDQQIKDRFNLLLPLSDSTCGG